MVGEGDAGVAYDVCDAISLRALGLVGVTFHCPGREARRNPPLPLTRNGVILSDMDAPILEG